MQMTQGASIEAGFGYAWHLMRRFLQLFRARRLESVRVSEKWRGSERNSALVARAGDSALLGLMRGVATCAVSVAVHAAPVRPVVHATRDERGRVWGPPLGRAVCNAI